MTTRDGRRLAIAAAIIAQSPERVESSPERISPARAPAMLTSVQGKPPVMMSTGSTTDQSTVVMSPRFGTSGQWWAMILHAPGSMSLHQTVRPPVTDSTAMSNPE